MYLRKITKGYITISSNKIDITDPCYDSDSWYRMSVNTKPTEYRCNYYIGAELDEDEIAEYTDDYNNASANDYIKINFPSLDKYLAHNLNDIKHRCFGIELQEKGRSFSFHSKQWKRIGSIGVDSGMAGFFLNKPDFNDDEWQNLCDYVSSSKSVAYLDPTLGFWSDSGYGDGAYDVSVIEDNGVIIALRIEFN